MSKQEQYLKRFATMSPAEQRRDLAIILAFLLDIFQEKAKPTIKSVPAVEEVSPEDIPHPDQARIDIIASELLAELDL